MQNIVVFASGAGTNAEQVICHFLTSDLTRVALVVSDNPYAGVSQLHARYSIPILYVTTEDLRDPKFLDHLLAIKSALLVLAGFLQKIPPELLSIYRQRIVNVHPSLLPRFGGKGMYGENVHKAVLGSGASTSGMSVHYVDEGYDTGRVIFQAQCPVYPTDSIQTLSRRVLALEHKYYPPVIAEVLRGRDLG